LRATCVTMPVKSRLKGGGSASLSCFILRLFSTGPQHQVRACGVVNCSRAVRECGITVGIIYLAALYPAAAACFAGLPEARNEADQLELQESTHNGT
jgi:hypothetical protein